MRLNATLVGYVGVALVTANTIPSIWAAWCGMPVAPVASLWIMLIGLLALLIQSVVTRNTFYSVVNGLGLAGNLAIIFGVISH